MPCKHENPCQNGGTCSGTLLNYQCSCAVGYTGNYCESKWTWKKVWCLFMYVMLKCRMEEPVMEPYWGNNCSCDVGYSGDYSESKLGIKLQIFLSYWTYQSLFSLWLVALLKNHWIRSDIKSYIAWYLLPNSFQMRSLATKRIIVKMEEHVGEPWWTISAPVLRALLESTVKVCVKVNKSQSLDGNHMRRFYSIWCSLT